MKSIEDPSRSRISFALGLILILHGFMGFPGPIAANEIGPLLRIESERALEEPLSRAMDVRWASPKVVFIAAAANGVFSLDVTNPDLLPRVVVAGGGTPRESRSGQNEIWHAARLGKSPQLLVVAAGAFTVAWKAATSQTLTVGALEGPVDVDVFQDHLLLLGARFDDKRRKAPDGAIAWKGVLGESLDNLEPVFFSAAGPGAEPMTECFFMELGAVRFLRDGSYVIAPGVEPGIFWFEPQGKLKRVWENTPFGLSGPYSCDDRLSADPDARETWINQRIIIDDILPFPEGPGLILRQHQDGRTTWKLELLHEDGSTRSVAIPIVSTTGKGHLRGDVLESRIAFLALEYGKYEPARKPRLILARLER